MSTQPDQQKSPNAKIRNKCKKKKKYIYISTIEKIFLARFAHSAFYKIHNSGAVNRHAPIQYAEYVFFSSFFLSSHHDTNSLLHLSHFRKRIYTCDYILANINSESSRVIFSFFVCPHPVGQSFLHPQQIL